MTLWCYEQHSGRDKTQHALSLTHIFFIAFGSPILLSNVTYGLASVHLNWHRQLWPLGTTTFVAVQLLIMNSDGWIRFGLNGRSNVLFHTKNDRSRAPIHRSERWRYTEFSISIFSFVSFIPVSKECHTLCWPASVRSTPFNCLRFVLSLGYG